MEISRAQIGDCFIVKRVFFIHYVCCCQKLQRWDRNINRILQFYCIEHDTKEQQTSDFYKSLTDMGRDFKSQLGVLMQQNLVVCFGNVM